MNFSETKGKLIHDGKPEEKPELITSSQNFPLEGLGHEMNIFWKAFTKSID